MKWGHGKEGAGACRLGDAVCAGACRQPILTPGAPPAAPSPLHRQTRHLQGLRAEPAPWRRGVRGAAPSGGWAPPPPAVALHAGLQGGGSVGVRVQAFCSAFPQGRLAEQGSHLPSRLRACALSVAALGRSAGTRAQCFGMRERLPRPSSRRKVQGFKRRNPASRQAVVCGDPRRGAMICS